LDRWRSNQAPQWAESNRYVEPADVRRLEDWLGVLTSVVKELDPTAGSAAEANADLIREIEAQRNLMTSVATGGPRVEVQELKRTDGGTLTQKAAVPDRRSHEVVPRVAQRRRRQVIHGRVSGRRHCALTK
jgi:hypothetical protein